MCLAYRLAIPLAFEKAGTPSRTAPIVYAAGVLTIMCLGCAPAGQQTSSEKSAPNMLSTIERDAGWQLLFDGKTTTGWRGYRKDSMPRGWQVLDGALTRVDSAGDIVTAGQYANFELTLEWQVARGETAGFSTASARTATIPGAVGRRCRFSTTQATRMGDRG